MVYANLIEMYYTSESISQFHNDGINWMGSRKEYGIMRPEDKANMDAQYERQEYIERRRLDEQLLGEVELRDHWFNQQEKDEPWRGKWVLKPEVRERKLALLREWMKNNPSK